MTTENKTFVFLTYRIMEQKAYIDAVKASTDKSDEEKKAILKSARANLRNLLKLRNKLYDV